MAKLAADTKSFRAFDSDGQPVSGAKLYVYSAGTTTPHLVYADKALTVLHPWPIVANAAGAFEPIYSGTGLSYKVDMTTPGGVNLPGYPVDNIYLDIVADTGGLADAVASAQAEADRALVQADLATNEANASAASATEAMNSAIAAGAQIYANTADGLAATASGGLFFVPDGAGNLILYLDDAGTAVEKQRTPLRKYRTFAALKAATEPARGAGAIWQAGGFRYEEVSSGEHVTTSGGVKLKVLAGADGYSGAAFGATGDGVTDDTAALQAAINAAEAINGKFTTPQANYVLTAPLRVKAPITIDCNMANFLQTTANTDAWVFDEGATGGGNYQNGHDCRNIFAGTVAGTGNAFVFRNINESTFENLLVPGCGNIAFYIQGCLLSSFSHPYVGDGLTASPGFFQAAAAGSEVGIRTEAYNGLGPNSNTFIRPTATNCRAFAFDIGGTGNTIINPDAEGITSPAVAMRINGLATNVDGGNFEGTGGNIQVNANNCTIKGANVLGGLEIPSGVRGTTVIGGNVRQLILRAGSLQNTVIGTRIGTGGFLSNLGADNYIINVHDINDGAEVGMYRSGAFTPEIEFGGASGVSAYHQNQASWWRNGNIVNFNIWLQVDTFTTATGTATIDMLDIPFTPVGTADIPCSWYGNGIPVGAGYGNIVPVIDAGTKTIRLLKVKDSDGLAAVITNADFTTGDQIHVSGWFPVTLNT